MPQPGGSRGQLGLIAPESARERHQASTPSAKGQALKVGQAATERIRQGAGVVQQLTQSRRRHASDYFRRRDDLVDGGIAGADL